MHRAGTKTAGINFYLITPRKKFGDIMTYIPRGGYGKGGFRVRDI